ncbi:DUF3152 domain-containing protein [Knoellia sp. CPCC 206435]|uniref:DUF3152 domain-containing protein n=1 Tax=Knoellia terrae TaxID=3404797 RepID=UPI003B42B6BD
MPEDTDVPDWVSSSASPVREDEAPGPRRSEMRRTGGPQRLSRPAARSPRRPTGPPPERRRTSATTFARRRLVAALAVGTLLALVLWAVWPGAESTSPARATADIAPAALARVESDPTPAAEEVDESATVTPAPGSTVVPASGTGRVDAVALPAVAAPTVNPRRTVRVGFQVERGAGVDAAEAATIISATLGDARGWQAVDKVRFRVVSPEALAAGDVDITIVLASPALTDRLCAPLRTRGKVSCFNLRKVVLNARRWTEGVPGYGTDLAAYRQYMVNHEIGHGLYHGHVECPRAGAIAPLMLQQSKGLDGCRPNPWPSAG